MSSSKTTTMLSPYGNIHTTHDPLIKLAVSQTISNGHREEKALCQQLCTIAGDDARNLLHQRNPESCTRTCAELKSSHQ